MYLPCRRKRLLPRNRRRKYKVGLVSKSPKTDAKLGGMRERQRKRPGRRNKNTKMGIREAGYWSTKKKKPLRDSANGRSWVENLKKPALKN